MTGAFIGWQAIVMSRFLQFDNVAFSYPGMAEPLLGGVTAHFPEGCTAFLKSL